MPKRKSAVPAGMQQVQSGDRAPFHDFARTPILHGKVIAMRDFKDRWGNKKGIMEVAALDGGEISAVTSSASLKGLFKRAKKGSVVWIRFDGLTKIKGRKQPMRQYTTAINESGARRPKA